MKTFLYGLLAAGLLQCGAVAAQAPSKPVTLSLQEQPLRDALNGLARQTGLQVMYASEEVSESLISPKIEGLLTAKEALKRMLADTELEYRFVNPHIVSVFLKSDDSASALPQHGVLGGREVAGGFHVAQAGNLQAQNSRDSQASGASASANQQSPQNGKTQQTELETIVVTAQKREERLQDVPVSITAIGAEEISRRGLVNAEDYLRGIPGVNQSSEINGSSIVIRGLETQACCQNRVSGSTSASYFGETPTTRSTGIAGGAGVDIKLVDIERVEVLRGPQGTAFGDASLGGAVRTIPAPPKLDRFEANAAANYSNTADTGGDNNMIQAVGNIPLVRDKFAIRLVGYRFEDSGYYHNIAGSDPISQAAAASYGVQSFDRDESGSSVATGGRISALWQATDKLSFNFSYLTQESEGHGWPTANTFTSLATGNPGYEQTFLPVAPEHAFGGREFGGPGANIDLANATMSYDLNWADLLATISYIDSGSMFAINQSQTALGLINPEPSPLSQTENSDHKEYFGEIRLATRLDGPLNFLGGIALQDVDDKWGYHWLWWGTPETNPGANFGVGPHFLFSGQTRNTLKQKAAFVEASWEFLPRLTLTGGVRAYDYDRTSINYRFTEAGDIATTRPAPDAQASGTTFRANLNYKPSDDALFYLSWAQGFRLGTSQFGLDPIVCDPNNDGIVDGTNIRIADTQQIESDTVENVELGGKFMLLDRRLSIDAAIYHMDWDKLPALVRTPLPPQSCGGYYTANANAAISEGIELQAKFYITRALRIDVGGSAMRAELAEDAPVLLADKGNRLVGAPEAIANLGLQYEFAVGSHQAYARTDAFYVGSFESNLQNSPFTSAGDYAKLDASAGAEIGENLDISLFVHNLTNERATTQVFTDIFYTVMRPRTIGMQLRYSFD